MSAVAFPFSGAGSVTVSAAGTGTSDTIGGPGSGAKIDTKVAALLILKVTSAAAGVGDTLDVWVQHSFDEGTTWDDFVKFAQVLGNGGAKTLVSPWTLYAGAPAAQHATQSKALAAASSPLPGPVGTFWRVAYTVAGGTAAFTFAVSAEFYGRG